jgi:AcrR family transcriptional regulator
LTRRDANAPDDDAASRPLWFAPPIDDRDRRRTLTRERVVAEALTIISTHGVDALSMRALATRLGVVPSALYRHVRNLEQLHDLVLDGVLAEVDCTLDQSLPWTERVKLLARRLRTVLEDRPGIAGLLKTRDPLGPHTLALAEAFLASLREAGLPRHETGLAFSLIYDYTLGFALSSPSSVNQKRVRDPATRKRLHAFLTSLPADRFPTLVGLGETVWTDNSDERFTASLDTIIDGLETARRRHRRSKTAPPSTTAGQPHTGARGPANPATQRANPSQRS